MFSGLSVSDIISTIKHAKDDKFYVILSERIRMDAHLHQHLNEHTIIKDNILNIISETLFKQKEIIEHQQLLINEISNDMNNLKIEIEKLKNDENFNKRQIKTTDLAKIHELYKSGISIPDIALRLGFTEGQIKGSYLTRYRMQKIMDTKISLDVNAPFEEFEFEKIMYVLNNNDGRGMKSNMMSLLNVTRKQIEIMCQSGIPEEYCRKIRELYLEYCVN